MKKKCCVVRYFGFFIVRERDFFSWPFNRYRILSSDMNFIAFRFSAKTARQLCFDIFNSYNG